MRCHVSVLQAIENLLPLFERTLFTYAHTNATSLCLLCRTLCVYFSARLLCWRVISRNMASCQLCSSFSCVCRPCTSACNRSLSIWSALASAVLHSGKLWGKDRWKMSHENLKRNSWEGTDTNAQEAMQGKAKIKCAEPPRKKHKDIT